MPDSPERSGKPQIHRSDVYDAQAGNVLMPETSIKTPMPAQAISRAQKVNYPDSGRSSARNIFSHMGATGSVPATSST